MSNGKVGRPRVEWRSSVNRFVAHAMDLGIESTRIIKKAIPISLPGIWTFEPRYFLGEVEGYAPRFVFDLFDNFDAVTHRDMSVQINVARKMWKKSKGL